MKFVLFFISVVGLLAIGAGDVAASPKTNGHVYSLISKNAGSVQKIKGPASDNAVFVSPGLNPDNAVAFSEDLLEDDDETIVTSKFRLIASLLLSFFALLGAGAIRRQLASIRPPGVFSTLYLFQRTLRI